MKKVFLLGMLLLVSTPAMSAGYKGTDYNKVLKQTALEKCGYAPPRLTRKTQKGRVIVYQFVCGSIFSVISVGCIALDYKVRQQKSWESDDEYQRFQMSVQNTPTMYMCQ